MVVDRCYSGDVSIVIRCISYKINMRFNHEIWANIPAIIDFDGFNQTDNKIFFVAIF